MAKKTTRKGAKRSTRNTQAERNQRAAGASRDTSAKHSPAMMGSGVTPPNYARDRAIENLPRELQSIIGDLDTLRTDASIPFERAHLIGFRERIDNVRKTVEQLLNPSQTAVNEPPNSPPSPLSQAPTAPPAARGEGIQKTEKAGATPPRRTSPESPPRGEPRAPAQTPPATPELGARLR